MLFLRALLLSKWIFLRMFKCYNFTKKYRPVVLKLFHLTAPLYLYDILTAPKLVMTKKSMVLLCM